MIYYLRQHNEEVNNPNLGFGSIIGIHSKSKKVCGTAFSVNKLRKKCVNPCVIFGPFGVILGHFGSFLGHFGRNCEIWSKLWNLVEIVKFGRKHTRNMANIPEIYSGQHTHPDNLSGADPSSPDKMSSWQYVWYATVLTKRLVQIQAVLTKCHY